MLNKLMDYTINLLMLMAIVQYTTADITLAVSEELHADWSDGMIADLNDSDVTSVSVKLVAEARNC